MTTASTCATVADECALLSTTEAATALGVSTTTTMPGDIEMQPDDPAAHQSAGGSCIWTNPAANEGESVSLVYGCGESDDPALVGIELQLGEDTADGVSGVGTGALWMDSIFEQTLPDGGVYSGGELFAIAGTAYILLTVQGNGTPAELKARAIAAGQLVLSRL